MKLHSIDILTYFATKLIQIRSFHWMVHLIGFIPIMRTQSEVIKAHNEIISLEKQKLFDEARKLCADYLNTFPEKFHGPLLRLKADDLLFRQNDPVSAIKCYEKALSEAEKCSTLYGLSRIDLIYRGAALSSIKTGDIEKAKYFLEKLSSFVNFLKEHSKMKFEWHTRAINSIQNQIEQHHNSHLQQ